MPIFIYSEKEGKLIPKDEYHYSKYLGVAHLQMMNGNKPVVLNFIKDEMEPTRHMASGKFFTSKKKFRDETKAHGCIEVGNDIKIKPRTPVKLDRRQRRNDIKKAISELQNGRKAK